MFINVPPRCTDGDGKLSEMGIKHHEKIKLWNRGLESVLGTFQTNHPEATVLIYSSWSLFCRVYGQPTDYSFKKADTKAFSAMWADPVHPTSKMHEVLSTDIRKFLSEL